MYQKIVRVSRNSVGLGQFPTERIARILQKFKYVRMTQILSVLLLGVENLEKLARIARILHDSYQVWANCADFVQFTVNLVRSIFLCAK